MSGTLETHIFRMNMVGNMKNNVFVCYETETTTAVCSIMN